MAESKGTGWTSAAEIRAVVDRRWRSGAVLRRYAAGEPFASFSLRVRRPSADDVLERRAEVDSWLRGLTAGCAANGRRPGLRIESTPVSSRWVGRNELPRRVWIDSYETLFGWLGVTAQVATLDELLTRTRAIVPDLAAWAVAHPMVVLDNAAVWPRLLATVAWIIDHDQYLYLRQVDVPGVDTKFIEQQRLLLARLLDQVLPERRIDQRFTASDFAGRYRFQRRPSYTRLRTLDDRRPLLGALSELTLRTEELSSQEIVAGQVIIVENEISYLALPSRPDTIAIFGSGFAVGSVTALSWLAGKVVIYWGDLDTHGFAILTQLRARYPRVESILMDAETLLAHPAQWVSEEHPTDRPLSHLTDAEAALYRDLVEDRYGRRVRLEQERINFTRVCTALDRAGRARP